MQLFFPALGLVQPNSPKQGGVLPFALQVKKQTKKRLHDGIKCAGEGEKFPLMSTRGSTS